MSESEKRFLYKDLKWNSFEREVQKQQITYKSILAIGRSYKSSQPAYLSFGRGPEPAHLSLLMTNRPFINLVMHTAGERKVAVGKGRGRGGGIVM